MVAGRENARFPIKQQRIRGGTSESRKREASTLNLQGSLFLPEHWEGRTEIAAFRVVSGPSGGSDKTNFMQRDESLILLQRCRQGKEEDQSIFPWWRKK